MFEVADVERHYQLWLVSADGSDRRQLTDHPSAGWAQWHPDGKRIVYWAADDAGGGNLWLLDVETTAARQITHHHLTAWPQWSPDGEWLAYQSLDEGDWKLRLLEVASGHGIDVTQPADVMPSRPLWSPDGTELLYQSIVDPRFTLVRLVFPLTVGGRPDYRATPNRTTTEHGFLPIDIGAATQRPAWNPAGDRLAVAMYADFTVPPGYPGFAYKTWTLGVDSSQPTLMMPYATITDISPTWSPDGSWLAQWSFTHDLRAGVWLVDAEATRAIELTAELGGDAMYPAWSPDGRKIAFASNRSGQFDIWVADVAYLIGAPP